MNHKQLVVEAKKWLINSKSCNPVFCEKGSAGCSELPDAIGWTCDNCIVVECKASRSDLLANNKKSLALGDKKYFLMTKELYSQCADIIPDGYGIVTINGADGNWYSRQERFKDSTTFPRCHMSEIRYLRSRILEIQRYGRD